MRSASSMRIDASEDVMAVAAFATTSFVTAEPVGRVRRLGEAAALKDRLQIIIDTIPAVVWSSSPDGSTNFLNIRTVGPVRRSAAFTMSSFYLCNPHGQKIAEPVQIMVQASRCADAGVTARVAGRITAAAKSRRLPAIYLSSQTSSKREPL